MSKSRQEKVQDLLTMLEDLGAIKKDIPGNFSNHDLESLALMQAADLIKTLETAVKIHGMKPIERLVHEARQSRGQA